MKTHSLLVKCDPRKSEKAPRKDVIKKFIEYSLKKNKKKLPRVEVVGRYKSRNSVYFIVEIDTATGVLPKPPRRPPPPPPPYPLTIINIDLLQQSVWDIHHKSHSI